MRGSPVLALPHMGPALNASQPAETPNTVATASHVSVFSGSLMPSIQRRTTVFA